VSAFSTDHPSTPLKSTHKKCALLRLLVMPILCAGLAARPGDCSYRSYSFPSFPSFPFTPNNAKSQKITLYNNKITIIPQPFFAQPLPSKNLRDITSKKHPAKISFSITTNHRTNIENYRKILDILSIISARNPVYILPVENLPRGTAKSAPENSLPKTNLTPQSSRSS
jgi:hypothetical protein